MRSLYLHIGHGKTGSSFLQSSFARSAKALRAADITYPLPRNAEAAAEGGISSGNLRRFLDYQGAKKTNLFFSGEGFFPYFIIKQNQTILIEKIREISPDRISVLLFIRDPVEHCCSSYQQGIKGRSNTRSLSREFDIYAVPRRVKSALEFCSELGADITVCNYSAEKKNILNATARWLGVDSALLSTPPVGVVNRSMTRSEIALLLALNRRLEGRSRRVLADALCNGCPDIRADDMRPPLEEQEALWDRLSDDIAAVNARIPPAAHYSRERDIRPTRDTIPDGVFTFTAEQLDVIAEQIAIREKKLNAMANSGMRNKRAVSTEIRGKRPLHPLR